MRLIDYLDAGVQLAPDRPALVAADGDRAVSYAEVATFSRRIASAMVDTGLTDNARVAVYSPNDLRAFLAALGSFRAGAAWVPLNARNVVEENGYILDRTGCEWLFYHSDFADKIAGLLELAPGIRHVVCLDRAEREHASLDELAAHGASEFDDRPDDPDRLAIVFSSSGTTAKPKGCAWTNRTCETYGRIQWQYMPTETPPVHLVAAPMTHAAGAVAWPLMQAAGTQVVLARPAPLAILQAIERHRVTHLFLPPTVIYMLLAHPRVREFDYSSLEYFIYAAAPMSVDKLKEALDIFGPVMIQVYGQAEVPMYMTILPPADHLVIGDPTHEKRLWSCGRPTEAVELQLLDDDANPVATGETGEVAVRGDLVMAGYVNDPEATAAVSRDGWHLTGDIGYRDADGYLYLVDRKKDMIISGGFNIYSTEVEKAVLGHPAVQDCAVIGVPDEKWGEAVTAVVELKPGRRVGPEEIIALCKERIGSVKAPKSVEFWDELPRSNIGKVLKRKIRDRFWEGRARAI